MKNSTGAFGSPLVRHIAAPLALGVTAVSAYMGIATATAATTTYNVVNSSAAHVTADALPTAQIDSGVVWATTIAGDTVYAGGQFSNARPAGAAAGTSLSPRSNIMAFSLSTGVMTSFAPTINGTVRALALSPDQSILYVGGDFTQVNGQARSNIAAFSTSTGELLSFAPVANSTVRAIVASGSMVYLGGSFTTLNGLSRGELGAVNTAGTTTSWAPTADYIVDSMTMTPDNSRVIVAGGFQTINATNSPGIASIDAVSGTLYPFAANKVVQNYGQSSAIYSVKSDGTSILATGYDYSSNTGNFEGVLRLDPMTGNIVWMADCHGDSYNTAVVNGDVYSVSHHHNCANVGTQPEQTTRAYQRADSWTYDATSTVKANTQTGYYSFAGQPAPSEYDWFPTLAAGTTTGADQAAWSASSSGDYLVLGGEFPTVNGKAQYGLVRFTTPDKAPNAQGPMAATNSFTPTLSLVNGTNVKLTWPSTWDRDDQNLTYKVVRSDQQNAVFTTTANTQWWNTPTMSFVDSGLAPATAYTYKIKVSDADNNVRYSATASITTAAKGSSFSPYVAKVLNDSPDHYWTMNDAAAPFARLTDSGTLNTPLSPGSGVKLGAAGMNGDTAAQFSGTSSGTATESSTENGPQSFAIETWIKTTTTKGGKIVGFGKNSWFTSNNDRHVYMDNSGRLVFGVYPNSTVKTITTPNAYNDGQWHQVVAQVSTAGMQLYVDAALVASDATTTGAEDNSGSWSVGGGNLTGWPDKPSSTYFAGTIDDTAIYYGSLTPAQLAAHYTASGRTAPTPTTPTQPTNSAPAPAFTSTANQLAASFDASGSNDPDGSISSYQWNFGDGTTGTGVAPTHTYATRGTYTVTLTVTDNKGARATLAHPVSVTDSDVFAQDGFTGTRTNWGSAPLGGLYSYTKSSQFAASNGQGLIQLASAGQGVSAYLGGTDQSNLTFTGGFSVDKMATGGGTYAYFVARHTDDGEYRMALHFMADGSVRVGGIRVKGTTSTTLKEVAVPGLTYTAGQVINASFTIQGSDAVTITGSAWAGATQPTTPQLSLTDATPVTASGQVGFMGYLSGSSTNAPVTVGVQPYTIERLA